MSAISSESLRRKSPELRELHVLAVDDSYVDRKVIERLLKISCCKVTAVDSGSRALQFLGLDGVEKRAVEFDEVNLIITDYSMPGMSGYELLKKIKESSTLKEIPVVIMSSENILTRVDRCLEEGAEEFLVKPVKLSDVKRLKNFLVRGEEENGVRGTDTRQRKNGSSSPLPSPGGSSDQCSSSPPSPSPPLPLQLLSPSPSPPMSSLPSLPASDQSSSPPSSQPLPASDQSSSPQPLSSSPSQPPSKRNRLQ